MAIQKDRVVTAVRDMTKNPDWREILVNAPGAAGIRISLAFYASKYLPELTSPEKDEYREFREMLEAQLTAEELKYLYESFRRMGFEPAYTHYNELLMKKPPEEQAAAQKAYDALAAKVKGGGSEDSNAGSQGGVVGVGSGGEGAEVKEAE